MFRFPAAPLFHLSLLGLVALSLSPAAMAVPAEREVPRDEAQVQLSYAPVVSKAAPAVVNVYTRKTVQTRYAGDPLFERFFGDQFRGQSRQRVQSSLGSGVIVGADGVIVTNNHVVEGGDEFKVVLADRREFDATVMLQDERTDLAVLKIEAGKEPLPVLDYANSDEALVGDLVLAIGNPFGVGQTVTSGIISALARTNAGISDYQFFIQTDAAINPGNSGGALVSMDGKLVGVNTAIFSRSGGSNGIGFAIPANMVQLVVESAVHGGVIKRPWFGASGQTVTSDLAETLGLDRPRGVLINHVHKGGPADKAGLEVGDVVLAIGNHDVNDMQSLRYRLATNELGGKTGVSYLRGGKAKETKLKLELPPGDPEPHETMVDTNSVLYGVTVANLSPAFNEHKGLDTMKEGVIVTSVDRRSRAARLGLRPGDILKEVNGVKVETVDRVLETVSEPRGSWTVVVERGGQLLRVSVRG